MQDILSDLYYNRNQVDHRPSDTLRAQRQELDGLLEEVKAAFGFHFEDRIETLAAMLHSEAEESAFRQGFRLGARLMLEVLTPAP